MNPKVDQFLENAKKWKEEMILLRKIVSANKELDEDFKWMHPCYCLDGKNVVLIHAFKEYCALLFFKGALMKDPKGILIQQTENVQSARQMRFTTLAQIRKHKSEIQEYIAEAVDLERAGKTLPLKQTADYKVPEEFQVRLNKNKALKKSFEALTPGRQRAYLFYFSSAKQAPTREARIEKCVPNILAGKGLND